MKIVSIDLELNNNLDDGNTPKSKTTDIIQIGAVILDTDTGNIIDSFSRFCKLATPLDTGELRLSKFIVNLTGITDEDVNNGVSVYAAYRDLIEFCVKNETCRIPMTWGTGDIPELKEQAEHSFYGSLNGLSKEVPQFEWWFSKHTYTGFFDVKKMFQSFRIANNGKISAGLRKAVNSLNLKLPAQASLHNAQTDAHMTALVYYKLLNYFKGVL